MTSRITASLVGLAMTVALAGAAQAQIRLAPPAGAGGGAGGGGSGGGGQQQQAGTITTVTPDATIRMLSAAGFAKGEVLKLKDSAVKAVKFDLGGTPVFVVFFGCKGEDCPNFSFATFFGKQEVGADFINAFNRERRYARLYTDKEGALALTMDVGLYGGVSPAFVTSSGTLFATTIKWLVEFKPE